MSSKVNVEPDCVVTVIWESEGAVLPRGGALMFVTGWFSLMSALDRAVLETWSRIFLYVPATK